MISQLNKMADYLNNRDFIKIKGYPYVIHQCGTILRLCKGNTKQYNYTPFTKQRNPHISKGYPCIGLSNNGKRNHLVHRLLALAFISNPENKKCIDHIRGKELGNDLNNLRWATYVENNNNIINPQIPKKITKGSITQNKNGYQWRYYMNRKPKSKTNKSKEFLIKYRLDLFKELGENL